jgi:hypothetical protein
MKTHILYYISIIHNLLLIFFSGWTFLSLIFVLKENGIVFKSNYYFKDSNFDKIIYYFYLSKYYEFFDIILLYLQGKKPIFLQKYHHIGAAICWHLTYHYKVDVVWMATLFNSFVHTIMYSYYLGSLLKINNIWKIKKYITTLQLCQFIILYVNFYLYKPPVETLFNFSIISIFATYGIGIIILFSNFYYNNYIKKIV